MSWHVQEIFLLNCFLYQTALILVEESNQIGIPWFFRNQKLERQYTIIFSIIRSHYYDIFVSVGRTIYLWQDVFWFLVLQNCWKVLFKHVVWVIMHEHGLVMLLSISILRSLQLFWSSEPKIFRVKIQILTDL